MTKSRLTLVMVAVAWVVVAARWALIAAAGSPIPHYDQWDGEGSNLYVPAHEGTLTLERLAGSHMEHRPLWANLWNVGLFSLLGGWDPLAQMVANAVFPALLAAWCAGFFLPLHSSRGWRAMVVVSATATFAFPWGYQNTLWGFQSQFLLLVLLSVVAITALLGATPYGKTWWLGLAAAVAAPLAMAAGALAGAAVAVMAAIRAWAAPKAARLPFVVMVALGLAIMTWGLQLSVDPGGVEFLRVRSVTRWLLVTATGLAWPWHQAWGWALGSLAPVGTWIFLVVTRRLAPDGPSTALAGVCVWSAFSMMAMAYVRGGASVDSAVPVSRYLDTIVPGVMASALLWWWLPGGLAVKCRRIWVGVVGAGVLMAAVGFFRQTLPRLQQQRAAVLEAAHAEIQSGGSGEYLEAVGSHPTAAAISRILNRGGAGGWLPAELTRPAAEFWAMSNSLGTTVSLAAEEVGYEWTSGEFRLETQGLLLLLQGEVEPRLTRSRDGKDIPFQRLALAGGGWKRWGVRAERGSYSLRLKADQSGGMATVIWPRPLSFASYGVRRLLAHAPGLLVFSLVFWAGVLVSEWRRKGVTH